MLEIILNLAGVCAATIKFLWAVPVLGVMVLLATFGLMVIRAVKHR